MAEDKTQTRRVNLFINGVQNGVTIKEINAEAKKLDNTIRKNLSPGTAEYNKEMAKLKKMKAIINGHNRELRETGGLWQKISKEVKAFGLIALGTFGAQALFNNIDNLIQRNASLSDSFADVQKTTNLTDEGMDSVFNKFKTFNTRTSTNSLLELAKIAGKLGTKGVKDISDFVKEADKIDVALGEDLGNINEVVRNLGAINNLFKTDKIYGQAEALNKLGSSINALGASGTTRESYLVDFTKRVAGSANSIGLLTYQVLGYGSALDEAGAEAETSSTAISQFWIKMGQAPEKYAKIAKMPLEEFRTLLREDFNEAFIRVLEGANSVEGGVESLANTMGDMGADGARMIMTLNALAGNTDKIREKQALANDEWEKGTSLMEEFNRKNDNAAGSLARLQKWLHSKFVNSSFVQLLEEGLELLDEWVKVPMSETLRKEQVELNGLVGALMDANRWTDDTIAKQKLRKGLIDEIQSVYPDFLSNIDLEKATNIELAEALAAANKEYREKILLAAQSEMVTKQAEKEREAWNDYQDRLIGVSEAVFEATQELERFKINSDLNLQALIDVLSDTSKDPVQAINEAIDLYENGIGRYTDILAGDANNDPIAHILLTASRSRSGVIDLINQWEKEDKRLQTLMDRQIELQKKYGMQPIPDADGKGDGADDDNGNTGELTEEEKKELEQRLKNTRKFLQELEDLRIESIDDELEREIALLKQKHDLRVQEITETDADAQVKAKLLKELEHKLQDDLYELRKKYRLDEAKEIEEQHKAQNLVEFAQLEAQAKLKILQTKEGTRERMLAEQQLLLLQANWELKQVKLTEAEKLLLKEETLQKLEQLENEYRVKQAQALEEQRDEEQAAAEERFNNTLSYLEQTLGAMQDIFSVMHENRMMELEAEREALEERKELLDEEKQAEVDKAREAYEEKRISKQEFDDFQRQVDRNYNNDIEKLLKKNEQEQKELLKEQAKRNKALQLIGAIIDTARAVTMALAQPIGGIGKAIAVGAMGAIEIGTIAAQKIPEFKEGGATTKFDTFMNGGHVTKPKLGLIGEAGAEYVIPNWMLRQQPIADVVGMMEDMRVNKRYYATGGHTQSSTPAPVYRQANTTGPDQAYLKKTLDNINATLIRMNATLENGIEARTYIGNRDMLELDRETQKLKKDQQRGRLGG